MLQKHEKELLNVMMPLGQAIDSLSNLEKGVHSGNLDVDSAEVYNAINEAKELLDKSVKAIHDIEDRKQEEVLKNVNLDKLFEGHPVNAYVQAILGFLPSDDFKPGINMVDLISNFNKACLELAKHQQETEEALQKATAPTPVAEGKVISCECTENCTTYCIKNISKEEYMREVMEAHLTPCTCDDKSDCSTPCERDVLLDLAIAQLTDKKTFTGSDYGLIRYFLSVVEKADEKELEGLSNRALELAWNRYWYLRNEK